MWKLARDFEFPAKTVIGESCVDLSKLANQILRSSEKWSLDNLCRNLVSGNRKFQYGYHSFRNSFNSSSLSDTLWQHRYGSTLVQVMACSLMAPSH